VSGTEESLRRLLPSREGGSETEEVWTAARYTREVAGFETRRAYRLKPRSGAVSPFRDITRACLDVRRISRRSRLRPR